MWAVVSAVDEAGDTGLLCRAVKVVRLDERIPLVLAHDRCERLPDVVPCWVLWFVIEVVVDGLAQLLVFVPSDG